MRYVKITKEESLKVNHKEIGITSGKKDKETGKRETIYFCSSLEFSRVFGQDIQKIFIEI
jgi:hypothetical protein